MLFNLFNLTGVCIKVLARGAPPTGGGTVLFNCPIVKELTPIALTDFGKIKRVRGIAYQMQHNILQFMTAIDMLPEFLLNLQIGLLMGLDQY